MKRIPNKTAVVTICYTISGLQEIKIYDYECEYDALNQQNGKLICEGKLNDLMFADSGYKYTRWFRAECRGIDLEDGKIAFHTFTKYEEY